LLRSEWERKIVGLNHRDFQAVLDCIEILNSCKDLNALQNRMIEVLPALITSDITALTEVDVRQRHGVSMSNPATTELARLMPAFTAHLHEHPVIMHHTNNPSAHGPFSISDFLSRDNFRRLGLFNELYKVLGVEDQIAVSLRPNQSVLVGLTLSRNGWRFNRRDREVLDRLRPHLIQAYQSVSVLSELRTRTADAEDILERLPQGIVQFSKAGKPRRVTATARLLIQQYFPAPKTGDDGLPEELLQWVCTQNRERENSLAAAKSLVIPRDGSTLTIRFLQAGNGQSILLLSEQNSAARRSTALQRLGFTNREAEVMHWVIEGKTSPHIGVILSISTRTVHKHLERVFHKLNVETRTAAITRILEQSAELESL
jgi:DNA-binding CsgD family transcriptional regulator